MTSDGAEERPRPWRWGLILLIVAAIAFVVRVHYFLVFGGAHASYLDWAMFHYFGGLTPSYLVAGDEIFAGVWPQSLSYPWAYSIFVETVERLGASTLQHVRLVQMAIDSITVVPLFFILRWLGVSRSLSAVGGLGYALHPMYAAGCSIVLPGSVIPALFVWFLFLLTRGLQSRHAGFWGAAGLLAGISALCRPDFLLLSGPVLFGIIVVYRGRRLRALAAYVLPVVMLVGSHGVMNRIHNGVWLFSSVAGSYALYSGLGHVESDLDVKIDDAYWGTTLAEQGIAWQSVEMAAFFKEKWLDAIKSHPGVAFDNLLYRLHGIVFKSEGWPDFITGSQAFLNTWGIYFVAGAFIIMAWRRRFDRFLIMVFPLVYALASIGLVFYTDRYVRYAQVTYILALVFLLHHLVAAAPRLFRGAVTRRRRWDGASPIKSLLAAGGVGGLIGQLVGGDTATTLGGVALGGLVGFALSPWPFARGGVRTPSARRQMAAAHQRLLALAGVGAGVGAIAGRLLVGDMDGALVGLTVGVLIAVVGALVRAGPRDAESRTDRYRDVVLWIGMTAGLGTLLGAIIAPPDGAAAGAALGALFGHVTHLVFVGVAGGSRHRAHRRSEGLTIAIASVATFIALLPHANRFRHRVREALIDVALANAGPTALERFDPADWTVIVDHAATASEGEATVLTTSRENTYEWLLSREVDPAGAEFLLVRVDIESRRGGVSVTALTDDLSVVLGQLVMIPTVSTHQRMILQVDDPTAPITLVVASYNIDGGTTEALIRAFDVAPVEPSTDRIMAQWVPWRDAKCMNRDTWTVDWQRQLYRLRDDQ